MSKYFYIAACFVIIGLLLPSNGYADQLVCNAKCTNVGYKSMCLNYKITCDVPKEAKK